MGTFRHAETGVVVSVDDSKDARFAEGWESVKSAEPAKASKRTASKPSKS